MNLIDAWVTKVQEKPYYEYDKWWVKVESVDEGGNGTSTLMFETKEEADRVQPGYKISTLKNTEEYEQKK